MSRVLLYKPLGLNNYLKFYKMKNTIMVLFALALNLGYSQNVKQKQVMNTDLGKKAILAWEKGENSGNYTDFKALLATNFNLFSHPLIGKFEGAEALKKMQNLISEREKTPNNLTFSDLKFSTNETSVTVQFHSKGTVQGKFHYEGFNIIVFYFEGSKITGFQEYFGFIDPNWFKH
jgi:activator of HSP90 ATPase